jgi:hypothetical protein
LVVATIENVIAGARVFQSQFARRAPTERPSQAVRNSSAYLKLNCAITYSRFAT